MRPRFLSAALGPLCLLSGCVLDMPQSQEEEPAPIARIDGAPIFHNEFEAYVRFMQGDLEEELDSEASTGLFREFLFSRLLVREARRLGVTAGQKELEELVATWEARAVPLDQEMRDELYRYLISVKLLKQEALQDVEVSLQEMQDYYGVHAEQFQVGDQARVREILVPTREEAEHVLEELGDGDLNRFRALAQEYSLGATAERGGDLGYFERGQLPPAFEEVIFSLKPGEIGGPVESESGFHIFALEEWIPGHVQRFYEVQEEIFARLVADKERGRMEAYLKRLYCESTIEVYDASLRRELEEIHCDGKETNP
ncbi:MAG TPA: peptidylprolyl isomerase [Acidobacteriota bacterium]|nr:peptidylprolyl isomerase [Acidobacteriota bacterium]